MTKNTELQKVKINDEVVLSTEISTLKQATDLFNQVGLVAENTYKARAYILAVVKGKELYKQKYKNMVEYGATLGMSRTDTFNSISVAERFLTNYTQSKFYNDGADFSLQQLIRLLPLKDEDVDILLQSGKVSNKSTVKQIAQAVKSFGAIEGETVETEKNENEPQTLEEAQKDDEYTLIKSLLNGKDVSLKAPIGSKVTFRELSEEKTEGVVKAFNSSDNKLHAFYYNTTDNNTTILIYEKA